VSAPEPLDDPARFDAVARVYDASRPSYPPEAVDWLTGHGVRTAVDVGAGTGIFTRLLVDRARTVVAVEPSTPMLDELRRILPGLKTVVGTGERMRLPDDSADLVVFAQAWHWVDHAVAAAEVGRVLRPGGRLGLVWNLRDERVGWVRRLGDAMRADGDHFRGPMRDPETGPPFGEPERLLVEWTRRCTRAQLHDDVRSRSYFALLTPEEQDAVTADVDAVIDAAPAETDGTLRLPYVTACFRYAAPRPPR
jgi:SAM-dependent methyltransferase